MPPSSKTIQFCGDSFCTDTNDNAWTAILAKKLGAIITGKGRGGTAHEFVFKTFNTNATYTVICWTDANRVHIPSRDFDVSSAMADSYGHKTDKLWAAALIYYKHLHNNTYAELRQSRELYWFDHSLLSQSKSKIIHIFNFQNLYTFTHGYTFEKTLSSMYKTWGPTNNIYCNHLSYEDNQLLAEEVYHKFTDPLLFS